MNFKTEQEIFWAGEFGTNYIKRNSSEEYLASNLNFFAKTFERISKPVSIIEFGSNIGMNLKAIKLLFPSILLSAIEINENAVHELKKIVEEGNIHFGSIFDFHPIQKHEISLIKGVLIHINPEMLQEVYQKLYDASSKYILVCEYYNSSPVSIPYRGESDKLFKRDFAGEMLDKFKDLKLSDYGFVYCRDPAFPQDDITWFLLEKC